MVGIDFDTIVHSYAPGGEAQQGRSLVVMQAAGYDAGRLLFRGYGNSVEVALFELQDREGRTDYHCLTEVVGRLSLHTAPAAHIQQEDDGRFTWSGIGLVIAGSNKHSYSRLGMERLQAIPLVPEYPPVVSLLQRHTA